MIVFTTFLPVIRETVPSSELETQAEPKPHSMSYGPLPTGTDAVTLPVRVSMRAAVFVRLAIPQTAPGAAARLNARAPIETRARTFPEAGSMRSTSPLPRPPTQTLPPPAASPYVGSPTSRFMAGAATTAAAMHATRIFTG